MIIQHWRLAFFVALGALLHSPSFTAAGPLVCTTTFTENSNGDLLENSICRRVETTYERLEKELYTWRPPYNSGVGIFQSITEDGGIAFGGINGTNLVGFGFPEQTILWDAGILQKNIQELLENQTEILPLRTVDLPNPFNSSLADTRFWETTTNQQPEYDEKIFGHPLW